MELGHGPLGTSKKDEDASVCVLRQAVVVSRFSSLAFPYGYVLC